MGQPSWLRGVLGALGAAAAALCLLVPAFFQVGAFRRLACRALPENTFCIPADVQDALERAQDALDDAQRGLDDPTAVPELTQQMLDDLQTQLRDHPREREPERWAQAQLQLGNLFVVNRRLVSAEAAFRSALEVFARERAPRCWALLQADLGDVLFAQGKSQDAAQAYQAALEELPSDAALAAPVATALREALAPADGPPQVESLRRQLRGAERVSAIVDRLEALQGACPRQGPAPAT